MEENEGFDSSTDISVVTREEGSGTRGAFVELTGVEEKDADGNKGDIEIANTGTFTSSGASGKIVVAGSSSVTPVMEKLIEAYKKVNPNAEIELQESDSTTGVNSTTEEALLAVPNSYREGSFGLGAGNLPL